MNFSSDCENWMSNLPASIRNEIPIINLAIPGSHDSCSYGINGESKIAPDSEEIVKLIFPFVPCIVKRWSKTQKYSMMEQLESGIRYFDLRTAYNKHDNQLFFVHGVYCIDITQPLEELVKFLATHPKELVILDFQHFYDFSREQHRELCKYLSVLFGSKIYERFAADEKFSTFTLAEAFATAKQLIIIYRETRFIDIKFFYSYQWPNPWPQKTKTSDLLRALDEKLQQRRPDQGYCTQVLLTPTVEFILPRFYSTLRKKCAKKVDKKCRAWVEQQEPGIFKDSEKRRSNVFLIDFVDLEDSSFPKIIIDLNMKLMKN